MSSSASYNRSLSPILIIDVPGFDPLVMENLLSVSMSSDSSRNEEARL